MRFGMEFNIHTAAYMVLPSKVNSLKSESISIQREYLNSYPPLITLSHHQNIWY